MNDKKIWLETEDGQKLFIIKTEKCDMQKELTETIDFLQQELQRKDNIINELKKWLNSDETMTYFEVVRVKDVRYINIGNGTYESAGINGFGTEGSKLYAFTANGADATGYELTTYGSGSNIQYFTYLSQNIYQLVVVATHTTNSAVYKDTKISGIYIQQLDRLQSAGNNEIIGDNDDIYEGYYKGVADANILGIEKVASTYYISLSHNNYFRASEGMLGKNDDILFNATNLANDTTYIYIYKGADNTYYTYDDYVITV